jgi:hypothetical protein
MPRILLIALLFYLIIWVVRGLIQSGRPAPPSSDEKELVRDALTGVYFVKSKAVTVTRDGETWHFSSVENRDAWLNERGRRP